LFAFDVVLVVHDGSTTEMTWYDYAIVLLTGVVSVHQ